MPKRLAVQRHEWLAVALAFAYFFCVLAAYYVLRPVRDQLSAAVGSTSLPIFYAATLAATLALTPIYGALVARFSRRVFVPVVYLFFIAGMIAFIPAFEMQDAIGAKLLGSIFFVWVSVFNLFVVAVFWSFMADIFDAEQAHRLFPVITLGGATGALAGPAMTKAFVALVGVSGLLIVSCVLLGLAIACVVALSAWARQHPVVGDAKRDTRVIGGGFLAGATYATREARIGFAAGIDLYANTLQMALQIVLTRPLMVRFGPAAAMATDGAIKAIMLAGLIVFAGPWIAIVAVITRASAYGVFKPASDSLYTRVDAETRYKTKNFIDTSVWRFGDLAVTSSLNLLRAIGVAVPGFAALTMIAAASSGWLGWRIVRTPELASQSSLSER